MQPYITKTRLLEKILGLEIILLFKEQEMLSHKLFQWIDQKEKKIARNMFSQKNACVVLLQKKKLAKLQKKRMQLEGV